MKVILMTPDMVSPNTEAKTPGAVLTQMKVPPVPFGGTP